MWLHDPQVSFQSFTHVPQALQCAASASDLA